MIGFELPRVKEVTVLFLQLVLLEVWPSNVQNLREKLGIKAKHFKIIN